MKVIKKAAALVISAIVLTACHDISQKPVGRFSRFSEDNTPAETIEQAEQETQPYTEYVAQVPEITPAEAEMRIEAEDCTLNGSLYTEDERKGFSGDGYVTGFYGGSADYLVIPAKIPASQHYDITVCAAADTHVTNNIIVNDENIGDFEINNKNGKFVRVTFYGVYMEKGANLIQINKGDNKFDLDYIEIVNNEDIYEETLEPDPKPVSEKSSYEMRDLFRYLKQNCGEYIITGQYVSNSKNYEINDIHERTGQYPAIRFGDIGGYAEGDPPLESEIQAAKDWNEKGGIVGFMWYWRSPGKEGSVYSNDTKFDLSKAVTKEDISQLGIGEIRKLCSEQKISEECLALVEDIDTVSEGLTELAEEGIPVLWRPLHEAGGSWYWWGSKGAEPYKWLYTLMFERMTQYHKLDNLIWIWNGQNEDYLVDEDMYDIASIDVYLGEGETYGSRSQQFRWLSKITENKKMLALSECSSIPDIDDMLRDKSMWSFFGLWFGEYMGSSGGGKYTTDEQLYRMYNAENSITLDKYAGIYTHPN